MENRERRYEPFIITQIRELQNEFILAPEELQATKQAFSDCLYKYIDYMPPKSCFRIFRYKNKIYLTYYWLSDMFEPKSGRGGIYLILGVSCTYSDFKRSPLQLSEKLIALLSIVRGVFEVKENELLSTNIINILWNEDNINKYINEIREIWNHFMSAWLNYTIKIPRKYSYRIRKSNMVYILSQNNMSNHIYAFTITAARNIGYLSLTCDYSDTLGYGDRLIKVLFAGDKLYCKKAKVRFESIYVNDNTLQFIEFFGRSSPTIMNAIRNMYK